MATEKRMIAYDPIAFQQLTRRSLPHNLCDMGFLDAASKIKSWLEENTVDAVEVVRCKDCKHMNVVGVGFRWCKAWERMQSMGDDGFCCFGERNEK